jgi:hypothetical protein
MADLPSTLATMLVLHPNKLLAVSLYMFEKQLQCNLTEDK